MSTNPSSKILSNGANFTTQTHHDTYPTISTLSANLAGKSVFITGASKGIGKGIALSYAAAGCSRIALAARSSLSTVHTEVFSAASSAKRPAPEVLCIALDVTSASSVAAAAEKVSGEWGGLDILINNAGDSAPWVPLTESDPDTYWRSWEVNMKGPYLVTRAFLPLLLHTDASLKTIVNVSSIGAHMLMRGASAYQVAKLALLRFTEFVDAEYGVGAGVIALAIHPGGVQTELATALPKAMYDMLVDRPQLAGDTVVWLTRERRNW